MSTEIDLQQEIDHASVDGVKIRNLLKNTTDLIYFKDLNSVFTLSSDCLLERLSKGSLKTLAGKSDFDFFDPECAERFFNDEQEIIRTGKPMTGKVETEIRNGEKTWVFSSKMPLRDKDGQIVGTFGISRDITKEKQTELRLEETNKQLVEASRRAGMAEIATDVIHNVGNVLNSIMVAASRSKDVCDSLEFDNIERVAELIDQHAGDGDFFNEGNRGSHVPEYLRGLVSRLRSKQDQIKEELTATQRHLDHIRNIIVQQQEHATATRIIERVDLSCLITDAILMSSSSLKNHNIELVKDFETGTFVETDKHRVLQVIVNLIRNAKHACRDSVSKQKQISISVTPATDSGFTVTISDNGIGISSENIVKVFRYGYTTREQGHGFGLHSCANAAREMGGSLAVQSDGIGCGASFVLTLPGSME